MSPLQASPPRLTYPETDLFIVCFSMVGRDSFENVKMVVGVSSAVCVSSPRPQWLDDLNKRAPGVPRFLVGTKADLRGQVDTSGRAASTTAKDKGPPSDQEIAKLVKENKELLGWMPVRWVLWCVLMCLLSAMNDAGSVVAAFKKGATLAINGPEPGEGGGLLNKCFPCLFP